MRVVVASILSLLVAAFATIRALPSTDQKKPTVRGDVLAAVEKELARLAQQAEKESGPAHPRPSSEVAFLLLTGLAARGSQVKQPMAEQFRQLGLTPSRRESVQLFTVAEDAWIVIRAVAIQDKSGYWASKSATLYRRQGEKWVERGSGSTAIDGLSLAN
jgi:hypothetical protein